MKLLFIHQVSVVYHDVRQVVVRYIHSVNQCQLKLLAFVIQYNVETHLLAVIHFACFLLVVLFCNKVDNLQW